MFGFLLKWALFSLALIHGYLYLTYTTFDPCKAAAQAAINQQSSGAGKALGELVAGPIESRLRSKGVITCYRTAVLGEDVESLLQ